MLEMMIPQCKSYFLLAGSIVRQINVVLLPRNVTRPFSSTTLSLTLKMLAIAHRLQTLTVDMLVVDNGKKACDEGCSQAWRRKRNARTIESFLQGFSGSQKGQTSCQKDCCQEEGRGSQKGKSYCAVPATIIH
jgi:hypothetical protein